MLSSCQKKALKILNEGNDNVFLTGSAGSGKSFLIREFMKKKDRKLFPIVASTGAAAVLVGGRTFHSFFGLGIMEGGVDQTVKRALSNKRVVSRLRKIHGFVLDEVSMLSGPTIRAAETICRLARKKKIPWGGARVIAVGDFAQLPPVNRYGEAKEWAFLDKTWIRSQFTPIVLKTMMRTEDLEFLEILNFIREGKVNDDVRAYLSSKTDYETEDFEVTHLFSRRNVTERFNLQRLAEIDNPLKEFPTDYIGDSKGIEQLKKNAPIPEKLQIKKSAMVMIRVNDPAFRYVNGTVGTITDIEKDLLVIELKKGRIVELEPATFSLLDADGKERAVATNFPVTLAYATTIHKAQGATLDSMVADLRGLWEPGQAYVALSRLRSGDGLTLKGWSDSSFHIDSKVTEFHKSIHET